MELTFEKAMAILEIADISRISMDDLPQIEKKAKKRWHPDKITRLNNPAITQEYTENFQLIENAVEMVQSFLNGTYQAGDAFRENKRNSYQDPEEVIRENAHDLQDTLRTLWDEIKYRKYKWHQEEIIISEGHKLKDILVEDFREDIAILSIVSMFYGMLSLGLLAALAGIISPVLSGIVSLLWLLQFFACVLGTLPLSRFWLPEKVQDIMFRLINMGLSVFNWAERKGMEANGPWVSLFVMIPVLFAKLVKYLILFPTYEIAKAIIGNKIIGLVKKPVNYYANAADWYIEELIYMDHKAMNRDELFHLSILYNELSDVRQASYNA